MPPPKCPRCRRPILAADTVSVDTDVLAHVDCGRPSVLRPEERLLLFRYCFGHAVAECVTCARSFRHAELASDLMGNRTHLCPSCRADLTDAVRAHLHRCATLPSELRSRAQEACEQTRKLIKRSQQSVDRADALAREAEAEIAAQNRRLTEARASFAALREAIQRLAARE